MTRPKQEQISCAIHPQLKMQLEHVLAIDGMSVKKWVEASAILFLGRRYKYQWIDPRGIDQKGIPKGRAATHFVAKVWRYGSGPVPRYEGLAQVRKRGEAELREEFTR